MRFAPRLATAVLVLGFAAPAMAQGGALNGDANVLCLNTGGTLNLSLDAGVGNAGNVYLVAGSASGTSPGFTFPSGLLLPLNVPDLYFDVSIAQANTQLFPGTFGVLDGQGQGSAGVFAPVGLNPNLAGTQLSYAFLVLQVQGSVKIAATSLRYWLCLGGSMLSMMLCMKGSCSGWGSRNSAPMRSEEKVCGLRETNFRSAYLVMAQKPGPSCSSCQKTGASRRRNSKVSWGIACWKRSGLVRSTSASFTARAPWTGGTRWAPASPA